MEKKSQNGTEKNSSNQNKKNNLQIEMEKIVKSKWKRNIRQNEKIVYLECKQIFTIFFFHLIRFQNLKYRIVENEFTNFFRIFRIVIWALP